MDGDEIGLPRGTIETPAICPHCGKDFSVVVEVRTLAIRTPFFGRRVKR
jgi:C4-type Zn-finger protein